MVAGVAHTGYFRNVQHAATCWDTTRAPCGLCTHESSDLHREAIVARTAAPGADPAVPQQGGAFVRMGPFE